jgi:hypothetical protein
MGEVVKMVWVGEKEMEVDEGYILEEIRWRAERKLRGQQIGFILRKEREVPEYIEIADGLRPGSKFSYRLKEAFATDGEVSLVSVHRIYAYPVLNTYVFKYKITNAKFVLKLTRWGDNYSGRWRDLVEVTVHGNCPFLAKLEELQKNVLRCSNET